MEDISKSVSTSTAFADKITKDIANANLSSTRMSENSMHVSSNADDLSLLAQELKNRVDQFKV